MYYLFMLTHSSLVNVQVLGNSSLEVDYIACLDIHPIMFGEKTPLREEPETGVYISRVSRTTVPHGYAVRRCANLQTQSQNGKKEGHTI